jgi:glycosyltransferase involved in cell wall biosynthesis
MIRYPESWKDLRVVLSHDWLTGMRGGERVLEVLCEGFPRAPIYTLIHRRGAVSPVIESHPITPSPLQFVPGIFGLYRYLLPLFPAATSALRVPEADLLISTSHCMAKGVNPRGAKHLCYCFTPMRYAWTFYDEYFGANRLKRAVVAPLLSAMRKWDRRNSERVDLFVTLSRHVQERIRKFYGRESEVVYPPVNTDFFTPGDSRSRDFDLIVSALVPYKRVDLAVRAYNRLGFPLRIVGTGTGFEALRAQAKPNVEFLGWQSDEAIRGLYRTCRCLVFPGEEDFGIVPVEAQACGCPVVAFARGGATESVADGVSGVFFGEQTEESLIEAVAKCDQFKWDAAAIRRNAERFSPQVFVDGMDRCIRACL